MDGPSPQEKHRTREFRDRKRADALAKAEASISSMEDIFRSGGRLRKPHFKKLAKHLNASFVWSMDSRRALAQLLQELGWSVVECASEADIAIASDCETHDVVISGDSDSLVYSSIETIWRPLGRGRYLVYDVPKLLKHLEISRTALTVLGIVCRNDYSSNISRLGVSTNFEIILSLEKDGKCSSYYCFGNRSIATSESTNASNRFYLPFFLFSRIHRSFYNDRGIFDPRRRCL